MPNNLAIFAKNQRSAAGVVTAANTDTSNPVKANLVQIWTAPSGTDDLGSLISRVTCKPRATLSAAAQQQLYRSIDGNTFFLVDDALLAAYTSGTAVVSTKADFGYSIDSPLRLAPGEQLWVGSAVALAAGIVYRIEGGDI